MKTNISELNPFGPDRYGFLWEVLSKNSKGIHLDYGAYDGRVIKTLVVSNVVEEAVGVDLNAEIVKEFFATMPDNASLVSIEKPIRLSYPDNYFDSVSILDVIEHVYDQKYVLNEIYRVLKPQGLIVVTVPKKHVFSWLDMGNYKFVFPGIHRFFYEMKHSKEEYEKRYSKSKDGLFGDVEAEKMWHQHFSEFELSQLLEECGFTTINVDGSGLFLRPLSITKYFLSPLRKILNSIIEIDAKHFESTNLFCAAQK
jgi:SAM-dependent methyltransferase